MSAGKLLEELAAVLLSEIKPISGEYFREVELKWGHPDDVVSGSGTFRNGNRFVPRGIHAVYAALTEETALQEYKHGQAKAYGRFGRTSTPHITYSVNMQAERCVDLRPYTSHPRVAPLVQAVLEPKEHALSQQLGKQLIKQQVQAILYPSTVPEHQGTNIVCILDIEPTPTVNIANREEILAALEKIGGVRRSFKD